MKINSNKIFFIKLPTGAGKTLLLYKLAMMIQEKDKSKRFFYLLPFITLIEQNASISSFHQLFYGIFKRKNALLKRFHQFINSVIQY
ncbi:DEAD/DEAH box helicase family protein [Lebetimonas sp. JH292]|uniref:DEAD/DEAH box helicase family protein n=1 Tax=Lebetimonas sp. JH292 TaxID=990068 RepID=UPI0004637E15